MPDDDDRPLFEKPIEELLPPSRSNRPLRERDDDPREPRLPAKELLAIARRQKRMLLTFLAYLCVFVAYVVTAMLLAMLTDGGEAVVVLLLAFWAVLFALAITLSVFLVMLAVKLFQPAFLVLLFVLHFGCGMGLISFIIVHVRATSVLRRNGVRVGLLGVRKADMQQLEGQGTMPKLGW